MGEPNEAGECVVTLLPKQEWLIRNPKMELANGAFILVRNCPRTRLMFEFNYDTIIPLENRIQKMFCWHGHFRTVTPNSKTSWWRKNMFSTHTRYSKLFPRLDLLHIFEFENCNGDITTEGLQDWICSVIFWSDKRTSTVFANLSCVPYILLCMIWKQGWFLVLAGNMKAVKFQVGLCTVYAIRRCLLMYITLEKVPVHFSIRTG